jgi:hypothetical protein
MEIASKRRVATVGAWAVVAFVTVGLASPAAAAAKKTTNEPVAVTGAACSPKGARDPGTALDCVAIGKGLQWQPKGSRANPLLIGEAGEIQITRRKSFVIKGVCFEFQVEENIIRKIECSFFS